MASLGIDIGTGSVRAVAVEGGNTVAESQRSIQYIVDSNPAYIVASSQEVWKAVQEVIQEIRSKVDINGICVDATCSLVVRKNVHGQLKPQGVDSKYESANDIVFWMDHRPKEVLSREELVKLGGCFIPEMAIPKIRTIYEDLGDQFGSLVFYDLHDWVESMLISRTVPIGDHNEEPVGIDGSLKGFNVDFLNDCGIPIDEDQIGRSDSGPGIPYAGTLIGYTSENIPVYSGLIDCYATYFANFHGPASIDPEKTMVMVAGTSACFLTVSQTPRAAPDGIWGGFHLLKDYWFFEGGFSCCGMLIERLLKSHPAAVSLVCIDKEIDTLIASKGLANEWQLNSHRFFSGDYWGNRTPYNDVKLSAYTIGQSLESNREDFISQYLLILEYMVLETRLIIECFLKAGFPLCNLIANGSVSKNERFISLLQSVLHPLGVEVYRGDTTQSQGAYGSAMLCHQSVSNSFDRVEASADVSELMDVKYEAMKRMIELQHDLYGEIDDLLR